MIRKNISKIIWLIIGVSLALHLLSYIAGNTFLEGWKWEHDPCHSSIEMSGSVIALFVATFLIIFERAKCGTNFNMQIASALIVMGMLDGLHAIVREGNAFVWLHSVATFAGGILFVTIFLPMHWKFPRSVKWPLSTLIIALAIGSCSLLFPDILPLMVQQGKFTQVAMWLNISGGILLFLSAFRLMKEYFNTRNTDDLLFCLHCSLFGAAATMFEQSVIWDAPWWGWHILRFMAYLVALWFIVIAERKIISDLLTETNERKHAVVKLKTAMKEALLANKAKSIFLSSMSHELRTPLNSVLGFAQLLDSDPVDPLSDSQKEQVTYILKSSHYLLDLINEVLDLSGIESGKIQISSESINVDSVIDDAITTVGQSAQENSITINYPTKCSDQYIWADNTRLNQILINLLTNAIKYNKVGGSVTIWTESPTDKMLRINIKDTGPGIAKEKYDALFEPFNRLGAESLNIEGTGVGLTISKRLVEMMGGGIGVESEVGKGTKFYVDFKKPESPVLITGEIRC